MMLETLNTCFQNGVEREICLLNAGGNVICSSQFQKELSRLKMKVESVEASAWLLYCDDTYRFALGLFVLLGLKKTVLICANSKPKWVEQFADDFDAVLSDKKLDCFGKPLLSFAPSAEDAEVWKPEFDGQEKLVFFTSGSTGAAKAIEKPFIALLNEVETLENHFGPIMAESAVSASVSHHHIYGLLFKLLWPFLTARKWVNEQLEYPEQLIALSESVPKLVFVSSPAFLSRLDLNLPAVELQASYSSGGPLPFVTAQDALVFTGGLPVEVYGSTETGGIAWRQQTRKDTPWQLFDTLVLQQTDEGITLDSPHIPLDAPVNLDDELQLLSGNTFALLGRKDRVINLEEKRVSLTGIERFLESLDSIHQCVALSLTNGREIIACVVVLSKTGQELMSANGSRELMKRWKHAMSEFFEQVTVPRKWRIVEEIPVNTQGKTDFEALGDLFHGGEKTVIDLPEVIEVVGSEDDCSLSLRLYVDRKLNVFEGHFDNAPVVAGVVQIKWAVELFRRYLNDRLPSGVEALQSVKFQNVLRPGREVCLKLEVTPSGFSFSFTSEEGGYSSGKIGRAQ